MIPITLQNFATQTADTLKQDSRIVGVALGGSYITGDMDEFSDLDFVVAVNPQDTDEVMSERIQIAQRLGNLLAAFTGEHVGEPRLLICLYDSPLIHVDFKFVSIEDAGNRVEDPVILYQKDNALSNAFAAASASFPYPDMQWYEDRFWVWVHYGAGKIGRGEIFEAIEFISFLRQTVIAPLILMKNGKLPRGVRNIETDAPNDLPDLLKTVAVHDVQSCISAIRAVIRLYTQLRKPYINNLIIRKGAAQKAMEYLTIITERQC